MIRTVFYFAYGSNMNPCRMHDRIPAARRVGTGFVIGWEVRERLYANLEPKPGNRTDGVLYLLTETELNLLDRFEGYPRVYTCRRMKVWLNDGGDIGGGMAVPAITYVMTDATRNARCRLRYPDDYRRLCSIGARMNGIKDVFETPKQKAIRELYENAIS